MAMMLGTQNGNAIVYNEKVKTEKLGIQYANMCLMVKRFAVKLSDGTKVTLNAGTSLRYPVKFIEGTKQTSVYVENWRSVF